MKSDTNSGDSAMMHRLHSPIARVAGAIALAGLIPVGVLYAFHRGGVCISQMRVLSDDEMYRSILLAESYAPYNSETPFQHIKIHDPEKKSVEGDELGASQKAMDEAHAERTVRLKEYNALLSNKLSDPAFVKATLARELRFDSHYLVGEHDGPYRLPSFWDIVWGAHPQVVSVRHEVVWAKPISISPTPYLAAIEAPGNATKGVNWRVWFVDSTMLRIIGPIERREVVYWNYFTDVCGHVVSWDYQRAGSGR